ncbi:MAG: caspase family protein, partial [Desulfobulbaceae bacterium]|nr:caspase family protein [Desulfobulbaceae bacterium]
ILTGMASGLLNGPTANTTSLLVDVDVDIPQGTESNIHAVGILIANQHYNRKNSAINDVLYAENDAIIMMKYLTQVMEYSKHNIIMEIDATLGDLRNIFGTIQQKGKMHSYLRGKGRSDLFIYYVGHGAPGPNGNSAYLVPVDADIDYIANNGYDLNELYKIINHLPARNVTIVLDTCFSGNSAGGPLFKNISPAMVKTANPLLGPGNTLIFAGADKGQVSTWYPEKQHSLFSYYFFKGLRGMADNNQDNIITAGEMQDYLYDEVPHWAQRKSNRKQTPIMRGPRDFILAKLKK